MTPEADENRPMRLLFHLPRTGGTLLSRCLASITGVCLLSEINPRGVSRFNPLRQAARWYDLLQPAEVTALPDGDLPALRQAIALIDERAAARELTLVVRDWSHLDWIGFPFLDDPLLDFGWDRVLAPAPAAAGGPQADTATAAAEAATADPVGVGEGRAAGRRCATVRHPLDQYLSLKELNVLTGSWDEQRVWQGIRRFAEAIQTLPWFRYEDFIAAPTAVFESICDALAVTYDSSWEPTWSQCARVTGDAIEPGRHSIAPHPRKPVAPDVWRSLGDNQDFRAALDLLGYPTPEPLRRQAWFLSSTDAADVWKTSPHPKPPCRFKDWDQEVVEWRGRFDRAALDLESGMRLVEALRWTGQADEAAELVLILAKRGQNSEPDCLLSLLRFACDTLEWAGHHFESIPLRRLWIRYEPDHLGNLFQLSLLLANLGEVEESLVYSRRLLELDRRNLGCAANFLLYLNYSDRLTASEVANEHFRLAMRFTQDPDPIAKRKRAANDKIRIGYLSADFYTHPVGKIILPILQSHDRNRFWIQAYYDNKKSDLNTAAIRQAVDRFTIIEGWSDQQVLETIRGDRIDILIDLGGYTGGGNRLRVLAKRAAPVQASFLGYPNTSALQTIDYHLTDRFADPPGMTEVFYHEKLVWLNHAHVAWRPYQVVDEVQVARRSEPLVGLFNNVAKISMKAVETYAEVLRRVPDARMVLKYGDRYQVPALQDRFRREFAARGVLPDRLEFRTKSQTLVDHLRTMASVDLALDSFPYQGTMTSLECLSVGTPVLSCCGEYYARRATSAMMMRLQLQELVAGDPAEYAEIAVQLLSELPLLRGLRPQILERFHSGPLADPLGLTRELEGVFAAWMAN